MNRGRPSRFPPHGRPGLCGRHACSLPDTAHRRTDFVRGRGQVTMRSVSRNKLFCGASGTAHHQGRNDCVTVQGLTHRRCRLVQPRATPWEEAEDPTTGRPERANCPYPSIPRVPSCPAQGSGRHGRHRTARAPDPPLRSCHMADRYVSVPGNHWQGDASIAPKGPPAA